MRRLAHQYEILQTIVTRVFIDVVDGLVCLKYPAKVLLHHMAMLVDLLPVHINSSILHVSYCSMYGTFMPYGKGG